MILFIRVYGRPAPEGSHEVGQHGHVMHSSKYLAAWRAAVNRDTRRAYIEAGLTGADMPLVPYPQPVHIHSIELLVGDDQCRAEGTDEPTGSPDLDKLLRATIDGLGDARAFGNDSQVTRVYELGKRRDPEPGAVIIISDEPPALALPFLSPTPPPNRGEASMTTEYRISIERVTGRDENGFRNTETVFELFGDASTIATAGLTTAGALLGADSVKVEAQSAEQAAPAAEKPKRTRKAAAPAATPEPEPEPATAPVAAEPAAAPSVPSAQEAPRPVNPFARG